MTVSKILVTGGAGFIGSQFVRHWMRQTDRCCVVLDKLTYASNRQSLASVEQLPGFAFVHGDIGDTALVGQLMQDHQIQAIVNFAAESHVDRSIDDPRPFVQTNVVGTCSLLDAALNHQASVADFRFLQISTDEVYGSISGPPATPAQPYQPSSPYAASKAAADQLVRAYHCTYGLPILIAVGTNNYGPFQFPEKLIPLMIQRSIKGCTLPLYGDGQHERDWLFVADFTRGIELALLRGKTGSTYHFGSEVTRSNREVVTQIAEHLSVDPERIQHVDDRPGHDRRYAIDCSTSRSELGWQAEMAFPQGLEETVAWYAQQQPWVEQVTADRYDGRRLGVRRS